MHRLWKAWTWPGRVAIEEDAVGADHPRQEAAGPGHLRIVANIEPATIEDDLALALEHVLIDEGALIDKEAAALSIEMDKVERLWLGPDRCVH